MSSVIGEILPVAVGLAISPIPIIAVILMLLAPKARGTSGGLLLGWVVGIVAATALCVAIVGGAQAATSGSGSSPIKGIILLVLAVLCLLFGFRQWTKRPKSGEEAAMPGWMAQIDKFTFGKAVTLGFVLSAINPKNFMMAAGAGAVIGAAQLPFGTICLVVGIFTVIGASTVALPVIVYQFAHRAVAPKLTELRQWLQQHNAAVMAVLFLVIGAALLGKGIAAF